MSKPTFDPINSNQKGWDSTLAGWRSILEQGPLPVIRIADVATLNSNFPASSFTDCMCIVGVGGGVFLPVWSNGTNWIRFVDNQQV